MSQTIVGYLKSKGSPQVPDTVEVQGHGNMSALAALDTAMFLVVYRQAVAADLRAQGKRMSQSAMGDANDLFEAYDKAATAFGEARTLDCVVTATNGEDVQAKLTGFNAGLVAHLIELESMIMLEGEVRDGVLHATTCTLLETKGVSARS